ncbi:hypothetical protein [Sphingomonas sp.]|uniref:hypothetical protein n=1 Tax=Sphingomonas sp. TaxID=28214 RepID=UPI003D6CCB30
MTHPRLYALRESDAAIVCALREAGDNPAASRPITVRFTGRRVLTEGFQLDMVWTGWEIGEITVNEGVPVIMMDCHGTSDDEALRTLSGTLRKIEGGYGLTYEGWTIPATTE